LTSIADGESQGQINGSRFTLPEREAKVPATTVLQWEDVHGLRAKEPFKLKLNVVDDEPPPAERPLRVFAAGGVVRTGRHRRQGGALWARRYGGATAFLPLAGGVILLARRNSRIFYRIKYQFYGDLAGS